MDVKEDESSLNGDIHTAIVNMNQFDKWYKRINGGEDKGDEEALNMRYVGLY